MVCPRCGTACSSNVRFCPKCGQNVDAGEVTPVTTQPKKKRFFSNVGGAICIALVALFAIGYVVSVGERKSQPVTPPAPVLKIDAATLWSEYEANEVLADQKYKGRTLRVTGVVVSIDKDFTGTVVLHLGGTFEDALNGRMPNPLMLTLARLKDDQQGRAAQLRKGNLAVVLCQCDGRILGSPVLSDCLFKS